MTNEPRIASSGFRRGNVVFALLAIAFAAGAVFHGAALGSPSLAPDSPPWRHALFVAINAACAFGMLTRPRFFPPLFAILCVQQLASHGDAARQAWRREHRVDVASLAVLIVMPLAFALLLRDRERRRAANATPPRDS